MRAEKSRQCKFLYLVMKLANATLCSMKKTRMLCCVQSK